MIRVLVVDDVRAICETIAAAVRAEPDLEVVGCATNLIEALPYLDACDVVLVNTSAGHDNALHLLDTLRRLATRVKIVIMGLAREHRAAAPWLEAGATSCVTRDSPLNELLRGLRHAHRSEVSHTVTIHPSGPRSYLPAWVGFQRGGGLDDSGPHSLTRREREVISLVRQGLTNQEIAETLVIELGTVKNHVHNILRKLKVTSRREAVHVSRQAGLWGPADGRPKETAQPWSAPRPAFGGLLTANS